MEQWAQIRHLHSQGLSIRTIARTLEISRNTVARYLGAGTAPTYRPRAKDPSLHIPNEDYLRRRLTEFPELRATRLFREVHAQGYAGSYATLRRFLQPLRPERPVSAVYRFETPPGLQAQVDWAFFGWIEVDGVRHRLVGFLMTLGFSRAKYVEFTTDVTTPTFLACHERAFDYLGGRTKDILYDNTKNVVLHRTYLLPHAQFNPLYLDFAAYYGLTPRLCAPYRAQTKGKVENTVKFVRGDFFEGTHFSSLSELNHLARLWCNDVNQRVHGTTHVPPIERLEEEHLISTKDTPPYPVVQTFPRKITRDCFVSFLGNRYSVPWSYAGRDAVVRLAQSELLIEVGGQEICRHEVAVGSGRWIQRPEHRAGLLAAIRRQNRVRQERLESFPSLPPAPPVEQRALAVYDQLLEEKR